MRTKGNYFPDSSSEKAHHLHLLGLNSRPTWISPGGGMCTFRRTLKEQRGKRRRGRGREEAERNERERRERERDRGEGMEEKKRKGGGGREKKGENPLADTGHNLIFHGAGTAVSCNLPWHAIKASMTLLTRRETQTVERLLKRSGDLSRFMSLF